MQEQIQRKAGPEAAQGQSAESEGGLSMAPPAFGFAAAGGQNPKQLRQDPNSGGKQNAPIQRVIGDGHDLTSPRFNLMEDLEAVYDGERTISSGASGRGVQAVQQCLYDLGFGLPGYGADGQFGAETTTALRNYQAAQVPALPATGVIDRATMERLNTRFATVALPPVATRNARWTPAGVKSILQPWSPHTIETLKTRILLKSFDNISWADEEWNGAAWVPAPFPGGGYNTGTEIGVLNSSNETMSETLYHEVLHANQPTSHGTTLARESYAYRIGEEFSIGMGLRGRASLRSTDARGRQFADPTKVDNMVSAEYPSVASSGPGEEIQGRGAANGTVVVRRPNGSTYTRAAAVGEKVPGPISLTNEVVYPNTVWN